VPGKSAESYLWERIATDEMPPKHPLTQEEKLLLKEWIDQGARWDGERIDPFAFTTESRAGYDWWALQPLKSQNIPAEFQGLHPVDAFVRNKLAEQNLQPSPRADRRTVIRRLSYDLLGLAPLPEEVRAFEADQSANAYENLVDRMLASPHYGERWARHWLDLARFGESHGFERDHIRDNSWPYRDWVINAFNSDLPYDQFARLQIAGDILLPGDSEALTATGFLVAGPYDQVGQSQQSKAMRAVVRQDEMEDYLGTLGQTFLGLTVNCARCHDHKFDPITQTDYYRMSSALAGVAPGERPRKTPELQQQIVVLRQKLDQVHSSISGLLDPVREQILAERKQKTSVENVPLPIARWTFDNDLQDEIGILHGTAHGEARIENGQLVLDGQTAYVSTVPLASSLKAKTLEAWVQLANLTQRGGGVVSVQTTDGVLFDAIVFGEREPGRWMAGSNGFVRTQPFQGEPESEADKSLVHVAIVYDEQGNIQGYRNGEPYGQPYKSEGPQEFNAGEFQILFGLRHGTSVGGNRLLAGRIEQAQIYDRALTADEIALTAGLFNILTRKQLVAKLAADQQQRLAELEQEDAQLNAQIRDLSTQKVYAISPRPPGSTHVLLRGNPGTPAEEVRAGGIASLSEVPADFGLPAEASDADRRKALAEWIANEHNPLFARVIVNRLWHYHFGAGIVRTPNDFGFNGSRPTHPELLDFLARYLVDHNWSLKAVHRLIVTSETYQQSSAPNAEGMKADAGNQWLWRYAPQRLEAEVIRDSMLRVTGTLNPQMGGPSYRNFDTYVHNSQFYEMQDKTGPEYHRRTIYRMWIRSGRNRFLDAFDCPDPSTTTPARAVTTTPTQSLSLLNNSFVLRMSDELTEKITGAGHQTPDTQVTAAYQLLFQRDPYPEEQRIAEPFVRQHGLPALARILFNTNEFLFAE
ncbi:MAG: DUF1553 domain-containing protein, partial [Planctomycetaceae bacterium]|nr:DUF1553 domain-containing protein [Planctomycetaceae bacterium]